MYFGFSNNCIARSDITGVTLFAGENDGWNISTLLSLFLKRAVHIFDSHRILTCTDGLMEMEDRGRRVALI